MIQAFANNLALTFLDNNSPTFDVQAFVDPIKFGVYEYISTKDLIEALKKTKNRASPGFDGISNRALKKLPHNIL